MLAEASSRTSLLDRVRVTDFGLARLREGVETSSSDPSRSHPSEDEAPLEVGDLTRTGTAMGTPAYMAPEQHQGRAPDAKADQYSLCVVLWEALYGERPFSGDTFVELAWAKQDGPPARPRSGSPPWLHRVVARGLAVHADDRHPSCEALADALASGRGRTRRRRTALVVGAAGVAAVAGVVSHNLEQSRQREACEIAGRAITEVWNADAAAAMHTAMTRSGLSYAEETFEKAVPWLEQWTMRWTEVRTETCIAAEVDETLSSDSPRARAGVPRGAAGRARGVARGAARR